MTKREQLLEKVKSNINTEKASDSRIAYIKVTINCDECPCGCLYKKPLCGKNCFANLYEWLQEHGDEEVEEC